MRRVIWTCWFQGREHAPEVVRACLNSWEDRNPGWDFRCLDASTIARYVDLTAHVDLSRQHIAAASLSDILRLLLLHEYGGVWVDATTFCNVPLDDWLEPAMPSGFFAFAKPGEDRELSSWLLAAQPGNRLLAKWTARAIDYWRDRLFTRDYFWVHHQFGELISIDEEAFAEWQAMPRVSADGPHSVQIAGLDADFDAVQNQVDWSAPVFKLTYRYDESRQTANSLLTRLLDLSGEPPPALAADPPSGSVAPSLSVAHLRVSTENLGDHIQIIAAERLLARAGIAPDRWVDRDDEIADPPPGRPTDPVGILLNGWFKTNPAQWPPHPAYSPVYLGFHIRLFQAPSLVGPEAIAHYKAHGPIGCRDPHTLSLLRSKGVDAFVSHCLTLTYPRRLLDADAQTEVFVVSRDRRIIALLPDDLGRFEYVGHYSGDHDFTRNMAAAQALLEAYRTRARLIVTDLLHCALPAIAMGIPVVVLYPPNEEPARTSDRERFSGLSTIVRVFDPSEASLIDWLGYRPDVSGLKLRLVDSLFALVRRWGRISAPPIEGVASTFAPPAPENGVAYSYFNDPERLERLARARAPDRSKWGAASSYRPEWADRSDLAATHIADGEKVLEIGTGAGAFRAAVEGRCDYTGADLQPIDSRTLALNFESDPLPQGPWDALVILGVLEYIHDADGALARAFAAAPKVVMSYCCPRPGDHTAVRLSRGWVNALSESNLLAHAAKAEFRLAQTETFNSSDDFEQKVFVFLRES